MIFVDWISISQTHFLEGELVTLLPIVHGGFRTNTNEDAEVLTQFRKSKIHEGSHSTSIWVCCDGSTVSVSGNVGRLNRTDNVFNLNFDDTMVKVNELLATYGLPPFSFGKIYEDAKGNLQTTGAVITKLDVTCNYTTGSPENLIALQNWMEGQTMAYIRKGRKIGATTCVWGSRGGRYQMESYDKAQEMLAHAKGEKERNLIKESEIYKFCRDNGVLRVELKMARQFLAQHGLRFLSEVSMGKLIKLFDEKTEILKRGQRLEKSFDIDHLPRKLRQTAQVYLAGDDVRLGISQSTFQRHAIALREFGLDISTPYSVTRLPIKVRTIDICPAVVPAWYSLRAA